MMDKLPSELIERIGSCMQTKVDVTRFRAICRQTRSSIPPYEMKPIRVRLPGYGTVYTMVKSIVYHLVQPSSKASSSSSSSMEWIVKVREDKPENHCLLLHPLSTSLPLKPNSESFPDELNMLEFQVLELERCYSLPISNMAEYKAVISSDPHWRTLMIMAPQDLYYFNLDDSVEIQECSPSPILSEHNELNRDVIFYKSKFYVIANNGTTISIDSSLIRTQVASPTTYICNTKKLVESLGDLLLVETCVRHGCKVYKLHESEKQWYELKSLKKDRSLFVDDWTISFSASTQDIPGCLGNHIFSSSDPYLLEYGKNKIFITLYVRLLIDSEVAVVELRVDKYSKVRELREHLDVADFPLPQHYLFMHKMSVMFEKESLNFHHVFHGEIIDVVPVPRVQQEQEEDVKVLVKIRGTQICWERNFTTRDYSDRKIRDIYMCSPEFYLGTSEWRRQEVYHELMTSKGPMITRLETSRKCKTYTNVRSGDSLHIVNFKAYKPISLKVNMIVDNEGTSVVADVRRRTQVKELRKELEKKKLHLPRHYYFVLLVQNAEYLMDEEAWFEKYFIYLEDVKYQDGTIENCSHSIANIKVCPYAIINKNKRRRLSYNL